MAFHPTVRFANSPVQKRILRHPKHPFHVRHRPFTVCPFFIAPVLPGETVKNIMIQSRAVSKTMVNPLIGAWMEYYFFYVKFSDFDAVAGDGDALKNMFLLPGRAMTDIDNVLKVENFYEKVVTTPGGAATQIPFVEMCLFTVLNNYFRDGDEAYNTVGGFESNGTDVEYYSHMKPQKDFLDSAIQDTEWTSKDVNVDIDGDATITAEEVAMAMAQWDILKQGKLNDMTFDEYLQAQGVNTGLSGDGTRPELLRVIKDFSYPVNTVDPTDGDPSTAFSWSTTESVDKDRFIKEPGFIFGVSIFRPKIYWSKQFASMSNFLNRIEDWMPMAMQAHPEGSMKKFNGATTNTPNESDGPIDGVLDDYWVDVRDLYLYGEQFVNFTLADADAALMAIPLTDLKRKYPTAAETATLFTGATSVDAMVQDGIVSMSVLGQQIDHTPTAGQEDD